MRIYSDKDKKELISITCNKCKKIIKVEDGIVKEGCFCGNSQFGYFSNKDGMKYSFDLCEECYDKMIAEFAIPAETEEVYEML
ncbi:MAG: hypothetical protein HDR23_10330 [Lachnospiraceae bacterium]|nr:hypothetical protein [Lachnospiraceae bacterium]MBD5456836.1 hypothetical protein [Lachnospiraceae bacterium]